MIQSKDILIISILTLITVMAWIVFDVYHASVASTITAKQEQIITPLSPKINPQIIENIRLRQK